MTGAATAVGLALAKPLGIKLDDSSHDADNDEVGPQESPMLGASGSFIEGSPTLGDWLWEQVPTRKETAQYSKSLLPFLSWIGHYNNLQWLASDIVAGVTIGAVVVPQGMAYALLAKLQPEYGLYSSFIGVCLYWIFGTSKDISIGPVAVLSTMVGNVVQAVHDSGRDVEPHIIASALSIISGCIVLVIGLLRCGWIVDLISITCLSAFMTGSAMTIAASQLPSLLGVKGFSNRQSPYLVIKNTIDHLSEASLDAAVGLSALFILYSIRTILTGAAARFPRRRHAIFFANTMRTVVVIILYTIASYVVNAGRPGDPLFEILGKVPKGGQQVFRALIEILT
jgi:solute carrier family 26 (sodium-independent sulfate anion transporter), member 11